MINKTVSIKDTFYKLNTQATVTTYIIDNSNEIEPDRKRPAIVICPGGGYNFTSDREAEPIALAFIGKGYHTFVLRYSVAPAGYPTQLLEVSAAVALVRKNAAAWNIDADKIAVCGFSSGGHLACSLGTLWNEPIIPDVLGIKEGENRPNAMILGYPVITADKRFGHMGSFEVLLGNNPDKSDLNKLSLENSVGAHTPPAFIWHTLTDDTVSVENSFLFAGALKDKNVPFELHIYPEGPHGLATCTRESASPIADRLNSHVESWLDLCAGWLKITLGE